MIQESQHTFIEYKTIKEVIDTGTLIMMLTKAGAVLYFEKKNITKSQYEGIREIFEKNNILCKMKKIISKEKLDSRLLKKSTVFLLEGKNIIYILR